MSTAKTVVDKRRTRRPRRARRPLHWYTALGFSTTRKLAWLARVRD